MVQELAYRNGPHWSVIGKFYVHNCCINTLWLQVEEKVSKMQRRYFLQEQLKIIKRELGLEVKHSICFLYTSRQIDFRGQGPSVNNFHSQGSVCIEPSSPSPLPPIHRRLIKVLLKWLFVNTNINLS